MNSTAIEPSSVITQQIWGVIFACWILATVGMLGSLFFSEVMELPPCVLCWYQRICMYPLVVILLVGLFPLDLRVIRYALPLAVIGWGFAVYHYLVYSGYIPESLQPCSQGVSCSEINLELFGFMTIPMMSILTFSAIIALLLFAKIRGSR
ncbi:MAG: disulfide bond formation protein B [Candidatus Thiodiazotropha sp. (ex Dulcina madagascariensis)]|nr:disulfide bond formation protein B [Candidatus Thiodiazotropha sp. (ex Dulcina madagascariensis)]